MDTKENKPVSAYSSPDQIPERYLKGLSKKERGIMIREIMDQPNSYDDWEADKEYKGRMKKMDKKPTQESKYTKAYKEKFGELKSYETALKNKSKKTGEDLSTLKEVYKRGLAAWKTGHRPGVTQHQWAMARVNSFVTGGKTRTTADKDLTKKGSVMDIDKTASRKFLDAFKAAQDGIKRNLDKRNKDLILNREKNKAWIDSLKKDLKSGNSIDPDDYAKRFPKHAALNPKVFKALSQSKVLKNPLDTQAMKAPGNMNLDMDPRAFKSMKNKALGVSGLPKMPKMPKTPKAPEAPKAPKI